MFDFLDTNLDEMAPIAHEGPYIPDPGECMRCGMCVSACPTFRLFQIDQETPRGRVRTIREILVNKQAVSDETLRHLDNCLQCRACENSCPSRMAYGDLYDAAQAELQKDRPLSWLAELAFGLVAHKRARKRLMPFLSLYLKSGLSFLVRNNRVLKKLNLSDAEALLEDATLSVRGLSDLYPVKKSRYRGRVALFTGCLAEHFDRDTQLAAIKVLNALGYEVVVPERQGCCGAIHKHHGRPAQDLIDNNIAVFYALSVDAIVYSASGCGAMLAEYRGEDAEKSDWFRRNLSDINEFVLDHWPEDLPLAASPLNIAVHEPCSQRNVLKNGQTVHALLGKIPGLNIEALPDNGLCCGAGGSYMLTHPENAGQLRQLKRQAIENCGADVVVSSNFGCSFYLNAGRTPHQPKLRHPLQLLADHLLT